MTGGEFARGLAQGRAAALELDRRLRDDARFEALAGGAPELDIVVWAGCMQQTAERLGAAQKVFDACAARGLAPGSCTIAGFLVSSRGSAQAEKTSGSMTCLRSVLMKPEHEAWLGEIWERLSAACGRVERG